jgi:hypothetical protein
MAATSIFFIDIMASKARVAWAPPAASASVNTRGVICQEIPRQPSPLRCSQSSYFSFRRV